MSEEYVPDNFLDRLSAKATLEHYYRHFKSREQTLIQRNLSINSGDVLSVGCGWDIGRHLFPKPEYKITVADLDGNMIKVATESGAADAGVVARAGELPFEPESFDIVLYRLVLHHIKYQGPLTPCFAEAYKLLRPGGTLIAVEPNLWHSVGLLLALANRLNLGTKIHGTPDDLPISPRELIKPARAAGFKTQLHTVTYGWRRFPRALQKAVAPLDLLGSKPLLNHLGHSLLLLAEKSK